MAAEKEGRESAERAEKKVFIREKVRKHEAVIVDGELWSSQGCLGRPQCDDKNCLLQHVIL